VREGQVDVGGGGGGGLPRAPSYQAVIIWRNSPLQLLSLATHQQPSDVASAFAISMLDPAMQGLNHVAAGKVFRTAAPLKATSQDVRRLYNDLGIKDLVGPALVGITRHFSRVSNWRSSQAGLQPAHQNCQQTLPIMNLSHYMAAMLETIQHCAVHLNCCAG